MTKVKICGLKNPTDIKCINTLSPDFAGFVMFFEKSHRNISVQTAQELLALLDKNIKSVAVTVSPTEEQLEQIHTLGFDYVQIHGKISEKLLSECKTPVIRAINVSGIESIGDIENLDNVKGILFDSAVPGSGKSFDWSMLEKLPKNPKMLFLAGGLTADNVAKAVAQLRPFAVDVSSGVELADKSGKDYQLVQAFIKNAKSAIIH
ncbi:phosphoribosylanthranilate isomerase [uncultured Ruminococcus sp.]|jgi:phosphoribosylanthranilate isomerase|uniref:phosphoribosylanthranilate isomerase n=1 Tax=uncultured Ruminococcus sp. TaxID=165186 RepID=UPI002666250F|nr:phosphoribosylanthranilate isomerase [uncultured Ruminococcus sp.]